MTSSPQIVDAFREAAAKGARVVARPEGEQWEVRAVGFGGDGFRVTWPGGSEGGTAELFMEGLRQLYGERIGREVSRQIGLSGNADAALEARAVLDALEMAEASQQALAGLNFISRHAISAGGLSSQFRMVCLALGVLPDRIPGAKLLEADEIFNARFTARADRDRHAVDLIEARLLMAEVLSEILDEEYSPDK